MARNINMKWATCSECRLTFISRDPIRLATHHKRFRMCRP